MPKLKKVKNPCKICQQTVNPKQGIQCQGACQTWVHFTCLNYTPGKILDIKSGVIKVNCPCPDCKTTPLPKEYRTDEPFSCTNSFCTANLPPKCTNVSCPSNHYDEQSKINQTSNCNMSKELKKCGKPDCKNSLQLSPQSLANGIQTSSSSRFGRSGSSETAGDMQRNLAATCLPSLDAVEKMCNTVGQLTTQINDLMIKMKQAVQEQGGGSGRGPAYKQNNYPQKGPKSNCPKPCYCPGNPR